MLLRELEKAQAQLRRAIVLRNRLELAERRQDTRGGVQERRARTHHLIELGGLVQKAGLVDLLEDDHATILGILLEAAEQLRAGGSDGKDAASLKVLWKRRGMRVLKAEEGASSTQSPASV